MPKLFQMLGTKNRKEQETKVAGLIQEVMKPHWGIMILVDGDRPAFNLVGDTRITTKDVKGVLHNVIDQITVAELEAKMEQEPPDDTAEPLNDSEVPENVHPDGP